MEQEEEYPPAEQALIHAVLFLRSRCDGAKALDGAGFNRIDAGFAESLTNQLQQGKRWTPAQIKAIAGALTKYKVQLLSGGIILPNTAEIAKLIAGREEEMKAVGQTVFSKRPRIDLRDRTFYIFVPFAQQDTLTKFKNEVYQNFREGKPGFNGTVKWCNNAAKEWYAPATEEIIALFTDSQYFPNADITPEAYALKKRYEQKVAASLKTKEEADAKRKRIYNDVLKCVGLHGKENPEQAPGITLYRHQIQAVRFIVWKRRCMIADEMGLGKTYEALVAAKALFLYYGWNVVIATTKSMTAQWARDAQKFGVNAQIVTWDSIPEAQENWSEFIFIADEAQYGKNSTTKRSQSMQKLALHPLCKVFVPMTGTPLDNSRPREMYPHLLCCHNPHVWDKDDVKIKQKKRWYEKTFCGYSLEVVGGRREQLADGSWTRVGGRTIKKTDGATNLELWHQLFVFKYGGHDNNASACVLVRRKRDHITDLPPISIYQLEAEIAPADLKIFAKRVQQSVDSFQANLKEKVHQFIIEYQEKNGVRPDDDEVETKRQEIRSAESMVMYQAYAMAGAYAKKRWILEEIENLVERGEKVVIFTTFKEVAHDIENELNKKYPQTTKNNNVSIHFTNVIEGAKSAKERDEYVADFQNETGTSRVIIGTKAGGEGITLTAASYMFIIDRAVWTPGRIKQWIGRIDRIGQKNAMTVVWVQIPSYVTTVDRDIDAVIEQKERGSNVALHGEELGIQYEELKGREEEFVLRALADISKLKIA